MERQAAIVLIIRDTGIPMFPVGYQREILAVTNRRFGTLSLPGGKRDPGDALIVDTAVRELAEEVGLVAEPKNLTLVGSSVNIVADVPDREVFLYHARIVWGTPTNVENGTEIHWRTYKQFADESFFAPFYRRHLPEGIDHLSSTKFLGST